VKKLDAFFVMLNTSIWVKWLCADARIVRLVV